MRIAAAILAFNRLESLKRCLDTVRAQSRPPDEIIVIDNASNDGTGEWLDEQPGLVVIHESQNSGPTGGFNIAMRTAYERGHDWVFVMDDDVYPAPGALERLLDAAQTLQAQGVRIGGLHPIESDWGQGELIPVPYSFPKTARRAWRYIFSSREITADTTCSVPIEIDWYAYHGVLIARPALESCGLPNPAFFYWCDDLDLSCRQRELGFRHFLVPKAVVLHSSDFVDGRPQKIGWRHYYMHRNRWRIIRMYGHLFGQPIKLVCEVRIVTVLMRQAAGAAKRRDFAGSRLILQGLLDGVLGRMGKRVSPGTTDAA